MIVIDHLLAFLTPHNCIACGSEGSLLCSWCLPDACPPLPARCYRCCRLQVEAAVCRSCRRTTPLQNVWVRTEYASLAQTLIHAYKFSRAQAAAEQLALLLDEALPYFERDDVTICYVPTATSHVRQRGYDHAHLLARALARRRGQRCEGLLGRIGQQHQVGSRRTVRQTQLDDAFYVKNPERVRGQTILLVDDIITTGATLETAARALSAAGARRLYGAAFAQVSNKF